METGVDGGSMLVPEVMWASSASMRLVAGFIVFMSMLAGFAPVVGGMGICMGRVSMPGISCIGGSVIWAWVESVANKTSANSVAASVWRMVIPSFDDFVIAGSVKERWKTRGSKENQIRRAMRGGEGGGSATRVADLEGRGAISWGSRGKAARN